LYQNEIPVDHRWDDRQETILSFPER
jgi:hypothetical protein